MYSFDACGVVTSDSATLTVYISPVITQQPTGDTLCSGSNITFTVAATGTRPFTYLWIKNNELIAYTTNSSYTINGVDTTDAGSYLCIINNIYSSSNKRLCYSHSPYSSFYCYSTSK